MMRRISILFSGACSSQYGRAGHNSFLFTLCIASKPPYRLRPFNGFLHQKDTKIIQYLSATALFVHVLSWFEIFSGEWMVGAFFRHKFINFVHATCMQLSANDFVICCLVCDYSYWCSICCWQFVSNEIHTTNTTSSTINQVTRPRVQHTTTKHTSAECTQTHIITNANRVYRE